MEWIVANWQYCLLGLYVTEKLVKISPMKWDDLLVDGVKAGFRAWKERT